MSVRALLALSVAVAMMTVSCAAEEHFDFRTRILPILTKAGCNAGKCHGAAVGQGGFKLSLLGFDPWEDYLRITHERSGRRLDLHRPAESLFLRKAADQLDHDGGRRLKPDADSYRAVTEWIRRGANFGSPELRVVRMKVAPTEILLSHAGATAQLCVTAELSDGTQEDVSALALYSTNDEAVAEVNERGRVTVRDAGVTSIMVRYSGQVLAVRVVLPFSNQPVQAGDFVPRNFVDEAVLAELMRLRLPPSPLSDDAEFVRRIYLDLIGRLPSAGEVRAFLAEQASTAKRSRLIAELIAREEFVDFWTLRFADWLMISGKHGGARATNRYHAWVREQIARNRPLDAMVRDLLLAKGNLAENGPANFYTLANDPRDQAEYVSSLFLGTAIGCARCHAHPADRWTQEDYYAFAAYFARVTQQDGDVRISARGDLFHPKTQKAVVPHPLGASSASQTELPDPRIPLADWLASGGNSMFSRNLVNRIWKHLLGRGLVEPVDDVRPTNPATNPALLEALASRFVKNGYDLRWLVREIAESRTYQLTSRTMPANRRDAQFFSHALVKPLSAQSFVDAVAQVTGIPDEFRGYPLGTRAVQLVGTQTPSHALDVLGRCSRERSCETGNAAGGGGLAQALHLINGTTINEKLHRAAATLLEDQTASRGLLAEEIYLRALARLPTADESAQWEPLLANGADAVEDLLWVLLNSREFCFNH
jgi:hypothetical protein